MLLSVLKRVFAHVRYTVGALGVAFAVLSAALLLPNLGVIWQVAASSSVSFGVRLSFLFSVYGSIFTNFTAFSALVLVVTAFLFGINIAFLTYYIRRRQKRAHNTSVSLAGVGGLVSSMLGIGCAACGSVVLTAMFGIVGAGGLLLLLPFNGAEFGLLGVGLLVWSINNLAHRINDPLVCPIDLESN